jgi:hypothetical protein
MTETSTTRRSFLKGSALVAAPLVSTGSAAAAMAGDDAGARLAALEDESALRKLHHGWLRQINAGAADAIAVLDANVSSIAADQDPEAQSIQLAADGQRATGRFACVVETQTELEADCTFAQMARLQGTGIIRATAARTLNVDYLRTASGWKIARAELLPA